MAQSERVFLGVRGTVVALDAVTGQIVWERKLKGQDFVSVLVDGAFVYGATKGEIFCLEGGTGAVLWHNPLRGYGFGLVTIATPKGATDLASSAEKRKRDQRAAAAAAAG